MFFLSKFAKYSRTFSGPVSFLIVGLAFILISLLGICGETDEPFIFYVFFAIGILIFVGSIASLKKGIERLKKEKQQEQDDLNYRPVEGEGTNPFAENPSDPNFYAFDETEKQYYFQFDKKFPNQGHYLDDANYNKIYEAIMTKFNLALPFEFDFVNHITGVTTHHEVGHTVTTATNSIGSTSSYLDFDGMNIWDYLHEQGIRIHADILDPLMNINYYITLHGQQIGVIRTAGTNPHAESGLSAKIIARGYFRIRTKDEYLDLMFLTALGLARSEQTLFD